MQLLVLLGLGIMENIGCANVWYESGVCPHEVYSEVV